MVPREAVIDTGTRQFAFVVQSAGHFDPRTVRMGLSGDGGSGGRFLRVCPWRDCRDHGQFLLDVESRTTKRSTNYVADKVERAVA